MTNSARGLVLIALLGSIPVGGAQLPPEILVDQLLLRAERLIEGEETDGAHKALEEISTLQAEHGIKLPPEFHFRRAQATFAAGTLEAARESVTGYLTAAGKDGEFYEAALALLEDVERILERRDAPACAGQPEGTECWMELANQPGCHVWNGGLPLEAVAEWTGACSSGFATGPGTLTWDWPPDNRQEQRGTMRLGRPDGQWIYRFPNGSVSEGPYVDGEENGHWIIREADGDVGEGPFVNGTKNGQWVERLANGDVREGPYVDGERNGEWVVRFADERGFQRGPYIDGNRHGHWVLRFTDSRGIQEGPYKEGTMHGHWVLRFASGSVQEGPYVDGEKNGHWVLRFASGAVSEGPMVNGERNGRWVNKDADGDVGEGPYVAGERNGHWVQRFRDGNTAEGPFVDGKRHGRWIWRYTDGQVEEGPYVDDEQHGRWLVRPPDGDTFYVRFVRGVRQER